MDRQSMVDIAGYGYPTLNDNPSGMGKSFETWVNPDVVAEHGKYAVYDLEGAKALLAEAGYKDTNGDGFVESPGGSEIKFNIIVPNGWTDWVNSVQIAVEGLTAVGINATLTTPEVPAWTDGLLTGNYDVAINSFRAGVTPHTSYDLALHSRNIGNQRAASARYRNAELDKLLDDFYLTGDKAEQAEIMNAIQTVIGNDMPVIPVFNNPLWYEYNTKRFTGWWTADNPKGRPAGYGGTPERVLHLLDLEPVAQ